jgi:hypothetical protein
MTDQASYHEAYAVFVHLSDRFAELSDEQHFCVMEAFNCLTETGSAPPTSLPVPAQGPVEGPVDGRVEQLLSAAAAALARLVGATEDGAAAVTYARAHALLIAALAAE